MHADEFCFKEEKDTALTKGLFCLIYLLFLTILYIQISFEDSLEGMDILQPYSGHHGPKHRTHRQVRECQHVRYGNKTHSKPLAHGYHDNHLTLPLVTTKQFIKEVGTFYTNKRDILVHMSVVNNPTKTVAILEPGHPGSCQDGQADRATVMETAKQKSCIVAVNAGFFNTHNGACLGNIVADGRLVQDSGGIQNVHFGITDDGYLYFGYLSQINLVSENFVQLAGGVIWIIRDGQIYLKESIDIECSDTEETGTVQRFANVLSARTVVGNNKEGQLLILQVDGRTHHRGSDDKRFNCARNVSTVLCVYEPECNPPDCSNHGTCVLGQCHCDGYWTGLKCDTLKCPNDCSDHGRCTSVCPAGYYGFKCKSLCLCNAGCPCHPVTGSCNFTHLDPVLQEAGSCYAKKVIKSQHLVPDRSEEYRIIQISLICLSTVAAISMIFNVILLYKLFTSKHSKRHKKYRRLPASKPKQKSFKRISSSEELSSFSDFPMKETSFNSTTHCIFVYTVKYIAKYILYILIPIYTPIILQNLFFHILIHIKNNVDLTKYRLFRGIYFNDIHLYYLQ
ncbi:hypothetical protein KUTeg_019201 [Tegillarca granosa]|uniref:EGF-like domain-containing protein n=1 Tax=Tegillarca granosa TaxID=220873 RepID=A0ABQ9EHA2_TEGGR|nr:hypothetical protein KUTeg_019201 [Tegillarca granosa]